MAKVNVTRREQSAHQTRQMIVDAAIELFIEKGYDEVTVEEVCEKAGVSKGTFYNHFKSKEQAVIEEFMKIDQFYIDSMEKMKKGSTPLEKLLALNELALQYIRKQGINIVKIAYHSEIRPSVKKSIIADGDRPLYKITELLVRDAQENGAIRSDLDSAAISQMFIKCTRGLVYDWCLQNGETDLEEAGRSFRTLFADGVRPR